MFPLRLCGGKLLVAVTRQRRYGPSRLRVNDDDGELRRSTAVVYHSERQAVSTARFHQAGQLATVDTCDPDRQPFIGLTFPVGCDTRGYLPKCRLR